LAQEGALTPATIFHRLEDRLWAGAAAERAKVMESDGKMEDVGGWLQAALERTPNDFEILSRFGEFLCRRGDHAHALALLNKAREQQPKSVGLLNNIGVALRGLSRRAEAISCFEQALNGDPGFRDAYYNLAVTLFETKRAHDAVARLDAALARWPADLGLQEIHRHFSRGLTQPNATPPNRR
jgi:tetratricopeptide (TPR) repeat protein